MGFTITLVVILFGVTLGIAAYSTWLERKVSSFLQDRLGPNRAGIFGLLQPLCDGGKFFFKEDFIPRNAEKWLFILAPGLMMTISLTVGAVMPWGTPVNIGGTTYPLQVADLDIGVLYMVGLVSIGVYGIMIGGWASNNKYSLMGAIRASSQMISYELPMGLALLAIIMMTGSLKLSDIVNEQATTWYGFGWNVIKQPLAAIIFITCAFAECNRTPFDLPECDSELVGGYHTEYGSMKLGLFLFAEYVNMFISSALIASLFFGGYSFPGIEKVAEWVSPNVLSAITTTVFFGKIIFGIFFFMWIRWTIPRFRYDQLMRLGWKILLPLSVVNFLITGAVLVLLKYFS